MAQDRPRKCFFGVFEKFETFFSKICAHSERCRNLLAGIFEILTLYGNIAFPLSPVLCSIIFVIENGSKSDFPPAKNPTSSLFDVLPYGDFGFISWGNQEKNHRTQILNSTTRMSLSLIHI